MAFVGGINLGSSFNVQAQLPLDIRQKVATVAERDAISADVRWEGMRVYVVEDATSYYLQGGLTNDFWVKGGSGGIGGGVGGAQWETDLDAPSAARWNGLPAFSFSWAGHEYLNAFLGFIVPASYEGQEITVKVPVIREENDYVAMSLTATMLLPDGTVKSETVKMPVEDGAEFSLISFRLAVGGAIDAEPVIPGAIIKLTLKRAEPDILPWERSLFNGVPQDLDFISVGDTGCYIVSVGSKTVYWVKNVGYADSSTVLPVQYISPTAHSKLGVDGCIVMAYGNDDNLKTYYSIAGSPWTEGPSPTWSGSMASTSSVLVSLQTGGHPNNVGKTSYASASAPTTWTDGYNFQNHANGYTFFFGVKANSANFLVGAVGDNGAEILRSTDGINWAVVSGLPFGAADFEYIKVTNDKFILAVGGDVYSSTDGDVWTTHTGEGLPLSGTPTDWDYFDGKYFALYTTGVYSSPDLDTDFVFDEFAFAGISGLGNAGGGQLVIRTYDASTTSNSYVKLPPTPNEDDVQVLRNLISVDFTEPED